MRAAPYLVACVPELKAFFAERPTAKKSDCMGWAIFTVEGQLMDVTLVSPLMAEIEQFARETVVRQIGLTLAEYQELETIVCQNMPLLHRGRQRIVTQIDAEALPRSPGGQAAPSLPHRDRKRTLEALMKPRARNCCYPSTGRPAAGAPSRPPPAPSPAAARSRSGSVPRLGAGHVALV
jgi:hypothetical protein